MNMLNHPNVLVVQPAFVSAEQEEKTAHINLDISSEVEKIPFHALQLWSGNVRKTGSQDHIAELAASIDAVGLLSPLIVMNNANGSYRVIAGRRRYMAIQELIEQGKLKNDSLIACSIVSTRSDATEISLVENVMQLPMHPADKYEAFQRLADNGLTVSDIAIRFGISESTVYKLLKLGMVSPQVMQCYRESKLDFAQVQAFAISDDAAEQNKLLEGLAQMNWRMSPSAIRAELVKDEIPATDKRVKYVGLEFYEMCGGSVRRDLFDDNNSGYVQDVFLLNDLLQNKVQAVSDELTSEGWSWVEYLAASDWRVMQQFTQKEPVMRALSPEEAEHYENLVEQLNDFEEECDTQEELDAETENAILLLKKELATLEQSFVLWTAEIKAETGVLIELERDGSINLRYGTVKRENNLSINSDMPQQNYAASTIPQKTKPKPEFSTSLMKDLTSHHTAALQIELARRPDIALVCMVYSLAINVCYRYAPVSNCIKFSLLQPYLFSSDASVPALQALAEIKEKFDLPESHRELWDWLLLRSQAEQLELMAFCLAHSIDLVQEDSRLKLPGQHHSDQLSKALDLDMRKWFSPTADNAFNRLSRQQILEAYSEIQGQEHADSLHKLKKGELALRAEREIGDKWLPSILRKSEDIVQNQA